MPGQNVRRLLSELSPPLLTRGLGGVVNYFRWRPLLRGPAGLRGPDWYDRTFELSDSWRRHYTESHSYPIWAVIADRLASAGATSVLELGCGSGQFADLLRDRRVAAYLGIDFSPRRIEHARRLCPGYSFRAEDVMTSDALDRGEYDAVVAKAFLEHVEDDVGLVRRVRAGALIVASVPSFAAPSHVRHFADESEVAARYAPYLSASRVDTFRLDRRGSVAFVLQGVRSG